MEHVLEMRQGQHFHMIYTTFLKRVIGVDLWKTSSCKKTISQFCNPSIEALMMVLLENTWDCWTVAMENEQLKHGGNPTNQIPQPIPKPLYTCSEKDKIMGKNTGWSKVGTKRYNQIVKLVILDRAANQEKEAEFLKKLQGTALRAIAEDDSDDEMPYVDIIAV